jgi:hypothetical protein
MPLISNVRRLEHEAPCATLFPMNGHLKRTRSLWVGVVLAGGVFASSLIPLSPVFIHFLFPFPTLEESQHWVGRVEISEPRLDGNKIQYGRQFIVTSTGKYEFTCGYFGNRHACPEYQVLNGAVGEVWFSPTHGALQWRFLIAEGLRSGKEDRVAYGDWKRAIQSNFSLERYINRMFLPILVLAAIFWQVCIYRRRSKVLNATLQTGA